MELKFDPTQEYALVLEGGGGKGAYQIGVWKALREAGVRISAVCGASVGALNGALIAMGDVEKAVSLWENIRFSQVMQVDDALMEHLFSREWEQIVPHDFLETIRGVWKEKGVDIEPLKQLLDDTIAEERIRTSQTELFFVTYSISEKKELVVHAKETPQGHLNDMLLASAYFPGFKQEKLGGKYYLDGCVSDLVPIEPLLERGYDKIIVIRLYGLGRERKVTLPEGALVYTVAPKRKLAGILQFEAEQSKKDLLLGYYDGLRLLHGLKGEHYYIQRQWSEQRAYLVLAKLLHKAAQEKGETLTLRRLNEEELPRFAKKMKAKGGYYEILLAFLEAAAQACDICCEQIFTEERLLAEILRQKDKIKARELPKILRFFPTDCSLEMLLPKRDTEA